LGIDVTNFKFVYRINILANFNSQFLVALSLPSQTCAHTPWQSRDGKWQTIFVR